MCLKLDFLPTKQIFLITQRVKSIFDHPDNTQLLINFIDNSFFSFNTYIMK